MILIDQHKLFFYESHSLSRPVKPHTELGNFDLSEIEKNGVFRHLIWPHQNIIMAVKWDGRHDTIVKFNVERRENNILISLKDKVIFHNRVWKMSTNFRGNVIIEDLTGHIFYGNFNQNIIDDFKRIF